MASTITAIPMETTVTAPTIPPKTHLVLCLVPEAGFCRKERVYSVEVAVQRTMTKRDRTAANIERLRLKPIWAALSRKYRASQRHIPPKTSMLRMDANGIRALHSAMRHRQFGDGFVSMDNLQCARCARICTANPRIYTDSTFSVDVYILWDSALSALYSLAD